MSLLLKNCRFIVTQNKKRQVLENKDVLVGDEEIKKVGKNLKGDGAIDCSHSLVMPGLINTHTHISMTLLRGVADDVVLEEFLEKTYKIDSKLKEKDVYDGAMLGCMESIRFGTTAFKDLYYFEDEIAKAAVETGLRANLAWATLDKEMTTQKGDPIDNCDKFIKRWKGKDALVTPEVGIQGVYVTSEETYKRAKQLSKKHGAMVHTHLSETRKEVYDNVKKTGKRPVEMLEALGVLDDQVTAAHCVWLTKPEMNILTKSGVNVSHNPTSNLKLASGGLCPVPELLERGANICLGTDSCASNNSLDMFKEMKLAALLHKNAKWDARLVPAQAALDMATVNGAKALGINTGSIEEGKLADIIISDLRKPGLSPVNDMVSNIVYSMSGADIDTSIINGKIVMRDGEIPNGFKIIEDVNKRWPRR
jgi:5-methylthioadenosine/S-adenosylhomocysteine deaminase